MPRKSQVLLAAFLMLLTAGLIVTRWQTAPAGSFELATAQSAETSSELGDSNTTADPAATVAPAPDAAQSPPDAPEPSAADALDAATALMVETGPSFTYQGRVTHQGAPVDDTCDLRFGLWDALSSGTQLGSTQDVNSVSVTKGLLTVTLNGGDQFGARPFDGSARFLEMAVRCPAGSGAYTTLSPRQELTVSPYAQHAKEAGDALALEGQPARAFQRRLGPTCVPGSRVRVRNAGGTVICERDPLASVNIQPSINQISTLDSTGSVGSFTSVTIGTDDLGLISYYDDTADALKVAHCNNAACTGTPTITTLDDPANAVGWYTSATIGADGLGLISYYDSTNGDLKVAHCNNAACSGATLTTLDNFGNVGQTTSVTVGADGLGLISYHDNSNSDLKVAHCNNAACSGAILTTLDSSGNVGLYTSATIGADGLGLMSYHDATNGDLKVAHCNNAACTGTPTITTLDSIGSLGLYTSVTIGADGLGLISYRDATNGDLKVAHCESPTCEPFYAAHRR